MAKSIDLASEWVHMAKGIDKATYILHINDIMHIITANTDQEFSN